MFPKPLPLNGLGLCSANDVRDRDPKNFRVYAKLADDQKKEEHAFNEDLLEGFTELF